ncbi:hypothetical protein FRZ61_49580 [Hypericibacter adhaerens]|uniref:Uncharacterized protein n=1 Tax=Hypericibacter adhaerens TaxID=2602016 RepID=A0A5J6N6A4_9PROT|nr:hypothetical protein FRZ61_49580 [Hypericibacter adhaerens]
MAEALGGRVRAAQAANARAISPVATIPDNLLIANIKITAGATGALRGEMPIRLSGA